MPDGVSKIILIIIITIPAEIQASSIWTTILTLTHSVSRHANKELTAKPPNAAPNARLAIGSSYPQAKSSLCCFQNIMKTRLKMMLKKKWTKKSIFNGFEICSFMIEFHLT